MRTVSNNVCRPTIFVPDLNNHSMDPHEIWWNHLCSQEDESYQLWWSPDFTSSAPMRLKFVVLSRMPNNKYWMDSSPGVIGLLLVR